jgi:hypothetical protein
MHRGIPVIEGCGSPNRVQSIVEKDGENNRKIGKVSQVVNQVFTRRSKHDKIQTLWVLDIMLESMMEKVGWCKRSKMES